VKENERNVLKCTTVSKKVDNKNKQRQFTFENESIFIKLEIFSFVSEEDTWTSGPCCSHHKTAKRV